MDEILEEFATIENIDQLGQYEAGAIGLDNSLIKACSVL